MIKRKIIAIYIGDLRFIGEPMGKFFFDYNELTKMFILRENQEVKYDLTTVVEDNDFILFEHLERGNPIDDEINQLDKNEFFLKTVPAKAIKLLTDKLEELEEELSEERFYCDEGRIDVSEDYFERYDYANALKVAINHMTQ